MLLDLGYKVTVTTQNGVNVIKQGNPNELHALKRINVGSDVPSSSLISILEQK